MSFMIKTNTHKRAPVHSYTQTLGKLGVRRNFQNPQIIVNFYTEWRNSEDFSFEFGKKGNGQFYSIAYIQPQSVQ